MMLRVARVKKREVKSLKAESTMCSLFFLNITELKYKMNTDIKKNEVL
jgi:hypothetical protein